MHRVAVVVVLASRIAYAQSGSGAEATPPPAAPVTEPEPTPAPVPDAAAPAPVTTPAPAQPPAPVVTTSLMAPAEANDKWTMRLGGYVQSQYRVRQNSAAANDEDGFRLARVRLTATAEGTLGDWLTSAFVEAELQPTFQLADAYATLSRPLPNKGVVAFDVGQTRVPLSRQQMISDSRLSFVDKAQLATIAPDRDLGARVGFVPSGLPVRVIAGAFNGEGKNQIQNINESYLYAGRVEVTPFGGPTQPYAESAFAKEPWVSAGVSAGYNNLTPGEYRENRLILGGDVAGSYRGLSGSVEYLRVRYAFSGDPMKLPGPDYNAQGWMAQLAYLLPVELPPAKHTRLEVGARVEEIDRNDAVPIPQLNDPAQSIRAFTGVISVYMRQHLLKAQLAFSHIQEIETLTSTMTDAVFDNDQVLLQITYRVE